MLWHSFKPKNAAWYCWRLNGAAAYLRRDKEAWRISFKTIPFRDREEGFGGPEALAPGDCPPESLPVIHAWGAGDSVFLHPYLSPKTYVLRLRERLRIAPGRRCSFVAALPPLLKFELGESLLAEEMPFAVPKTFMGPDFMNGEICHSLPLAFCRGSDAPLPEAPDLPAAPDAPSAFIHCDIHIVNSTKDMLEPERVAVNPEPLSVYVHQGRLVADALELEYSEADCKPRVSKITQKGYRLVSAGAKYRVGESFARRSVDIIKDITAI